VARGGDGDDGGRVPRDGDDDHALDRVRARDLQHKMDKCNCRQYNSAYAYALVQFNVAPAGFFHMRKIEQ
jgi:hypothetical protein